MRCCAAPTSCWTPAWSGAGRALVRDAPRRRAGRPARGGPLRRMRSHARGRRELPLGAPSRRRAVPPLSGAVGGTCRLSVEAVKLLKAYQRLDVEALAALRLPATVEREVEGAMRDFLRVSWSATLARSHSSTRCVGRRDPETSSGGRSAPQRVWPARGGSSRPLPCLPGVLPLRGAAATRGPTIASGCSRLRAPRRNSVSCLRMMLPRWNRHRHAAPGRGDQPRLALESTGEGAPDGDRQIRPDPRAGPAASEDLVGNLLSPTVATSSHETARARRHLQPGGPACAGKVRSHPRRPPASGLARCWASRTTTYRPDGHEGSGGNLQPEASGFPSKSPVTSRIPGCRPGSSRLRRPVENLVRREVVANGDPARDRVIGARLGLRDGGHRHASLRNAADWRAWQ